MAIYQLNRQQLLGTSQEELWDFISTPARLKEITPAYLGFEIRNSHLPDKIYPGMMISYRVKPVLGIKLNWLTEITQVREPHYFVDEQRSGPYALWHHEHRLEPTEQGVKMTDLVTYRLPAGPLGTMAQWAFVKKQLEGIFEYREHILETLFGKQL